MSRQITEEVSEAVPGRGDPHWHGRSVADVADDLGVVPANGLKAAEAAERLARHGPNRLAEPERRSKLLLFLDQFKSFLILVLIGAAVLAALVGDFKDVIVVSVVLLLNATLGYVQESRAERSMEVLREMLAWRVRVRRDGEVVEVDSADVVPGDVALVDAGDRVPADGRVITAVNLAIEEAALTGESVPVDKTPDSVAGGDVPLGDRTSMAYMNTVVTRGRGEILVTATGMDTEIGAVAGMLASAETERTPLQQQLDVLGKRLALVAGIAVGLVLVLALLQGTPFVDALIDSVALAIAAIPEGLPAVVTVTLAVGVSQMARRRAIVRRLASVETLGSTTVICSDKTGTLTLNEMTARRVVLADGRRIEVSGTGYLPRGEITQNGAPVLDGCLDGLLEAAALCSDAVISDGNLVGEPTEGALVALAAKGGVDVTALRRERERIAEVPFDSAAKYMATFCRTADGDILVAVKGAPDVLASLAGNHDPTGPGAMEEAVASLGGDGLRVLAVGTRRCSEADVTDAEARGRLSDLVVGLRMVGLVGIVDPPRPEVADAIALCRSAGIKVKMITGDHAATAGAVAAELGLGGRVVTGAELDGLGDDELADIVDDFGVCARVRPQHKVRMVAALKARGHVVAMTGDGVNDAPALKAADIGVAMGITGTEVTKEASDMVLTDDNFATIVGAVERGRTLYENIVTFVRFQLGTNFGALMTILACSLAGLPAPLTAIQILWVNLIMDGPPAMALGLDPPRPGVMDRNPRDPGAQILTMRRVARLLFVGGVMAGGTIGMFVWGLRHGNELLATSLAFTTFVLFQVFNALESRRGKHGVFGRHTFTNRWLWAAIAAIVTLQILVVQVPALASIFDVTALTWQQWAACAAMASSLLWLEEARKMAVRVIDRRRAVAD